MATQVAHLAELDAVNRMLRSVGEAPVNSLTSGLGIAAEARDQLRDVSRQVQLEGWHVNTVKEQVVNATSQRFLLGVDTLVMDTINPSRNFQRTTHAPNSAHYKVKLKKSPTDGKLVIWDNVNNTETWDASVDKLTIRRIVFLPFDELTPALQYYILVRAGRVFQQGALSSQVVHQFNQSDQLEAMRAVEMEEADNEDLNVLQDSESTWRISYRNNPYRGPFTSQR